MTKFEQIKMRFERGFVTQRHLEAYLRLGVISSSEFSEITTPQQPQFDETGG